VKKRRLTKEALLEARIEASSQLVIAYHEISVIQGFDSKGLVQSKAQWRVEAVAISVAPAVVSMSLCAKAI
jgi:hypothetical protein